MYVVLHQSSKLFIIPQMSLRPPLRSSEASKAPLVNTKTILGHFVTLPTPWGPPSYHETLKFALARNSLITGFEIFTDLQKNRIIWQAQNKNLGYMHKHSQSQSSRWNPSRSKLSTKPHYGIVLIYFWVEDYADCLCYSRSQFSFIPSSRNFPK